MNSIDDSPGMLEGYPRPHPIPPANPSSIDKPARSVVFTDSVSEHFGITSGLRAINSHSFGVGGLMGNCDVHEESRMVHCSMSRR